MRILLDTHALVWWLRDDPRLRESARIAIADETTAVFVSAASAWEVATKVRLKKMPEMSAVLHRYEEDVSREGFKVLDIEQRHSLRAGLLESTHGDPFDRMIAAQALMHELVVVTRDPQIAAFGCKTLW